MSLIAGLFSTDLGARLEVALYPSIIFGGKLVSVSLYAGFTVLRIKPVYRILCVDIWTSFFLNPASANSSLDSTLANLNREIAMVQIISCRLHAASQDDQS